MGQTKFVFLGQQVVHVQNELYTIVYLHNGVQIVLNM